MQRLILILGFIILFFSTAFRAYATGFALPEEGKFYEVVRILDGDTVVLRNEERVRLLGIDAPEVLNGPKLHRDARKLGVKSQVVKSMGLESKTFVTNFLEGKKIRLEYDGPRRDRNGRVLAYAFLENGNSVAGEILKSGYATLTDLSSNPSRRYESYFKDMQKQAMEAERGLWRFIYNREFQIILNEYEELTPDERRGVLDYIDQIKNGDASESYTSVRVRPTENPIQKVEVPNKTEKQYDYSLAATQAIPAVKEKL